MMLPLTEMVSGPPVLWEPIIDRDVSNVATVDLVWAGDFDAVLIDFSNVKPVTDNVEVQLQLCGDGGATWDAGASDYYYRSHFFHTTQTTRGNAGAFIGLTRIGPAIGQGNAANEWNRGNLIIARPFDPATKTQLIGRGGYEDLTPSIHSWQVFAQRDTAKRTDGLRFLYGSGNVSEGRFIAYGLRTQ